MIKNILTWLVPFCGLVVLAGISIVVMKSRQTAHPTLRPQFFLPNSIFVSLVLLINFWVVLLILLGARELPEPDRQPIVVIASFFAPFLSWWQRKRLGEDP